MMNYLNQLVFTEEISDLLDQFLCLLDRFQWRWFSLITVFLSSQYIHQHSGGLRNFSELHTRLNASMELFHTLSYFLIYLIPYYAMHLLKNASIIFFWIIAVALGCGIAALFALLIPVLQFIENGLGLLRSNNGLDSFKVVIINRISECHIDDTHHGETVDKAFAACAWVHRLWHLIVHALAEFALLK